MHIVAYTPMQLDIHMRLGISARHFALSDSIREYTERRFAILGYLHSRISHAHVVLDHDLHQDGQQYLIKAQLSVPGENVNAESRCDDLYQGIDLAIEKLGVQLRKLHDRLYSKCTAAGGMGEIAPVNL